MMEDRLFTCKKMNNRGLSLVELLIAISIGVIVSASIAALISFSIRMYNNESVNTSMQYELQSNLNMMMDEIMGASVFVVSQNSGVAVDATGTPYTKYALFGIPYTDIKLSDGSDAKGFKGVIFVSSAADADGKFNIYMDRINKEESGLDAALADINTIATTEYATISGAFGTTPNPYLLGENAMQFVILPVTGTDPNGTGLIDMPDPDHAGVTKHVYRNPIEFKVELDFEKKAWGTKVFNKHVEDITYLRNKVKDTVYVDSVPYTLK